MKRSLRVLLGVMLLLGVLFGALHWSSRARTTGFVLEPNEPALEGFSRQKRYLNVDAWQARCSAMTT
jgi:hypothetical protein